MQEVKIKLQNAFNKGFVPKDIKEAMDLNGHQGQVWVITTPTEEKRVGVGYKLLNSESVETKCVYWYTPEEVQQLLQEAQ